MQETPQKRDHAVLSALALCRGQALRLLDHGELPRGLRHARLQRHPVQPRKPDARRNLRHAQDHPRRRRASSSASTTALSRQSRRPARLGPCARLSSKACGGCCSRTSPTTTCSRPARRTSVREFCELAFARGRQDDRMERQGRRRAGHRRQDRQRSGRDRPALFPPAEVDLLLGDASKAHAKLGWKPTTTFEELVARDGRADLTGRASRMPSTEQSVAQRLFDLRASASSSPATAAWSARRIVRRLASEDATCSPPTARRSTCVKQAAVEDWLRSNRPDVVVVAAGKVGGIHANNTDAGRFPLRQPGDRDERHPRRRRRPASGSSCSSAPPASIRARRRSR